MKDITLKARRKDLQMKKDGKKKTVTYIRGNEVIKQVEVKNKKKRGKRNG